MDANRLTRLSKDILSAGDCPLFILLPARRLILRLLLFFSVGTLLVTLSTTLFAIVALPVLVYWAYLYYLYCHVWAKYRLSRVYTVGAALLALLSAVGIRFLLYHL